MRTEFDKERALNALKDMGIVKCVMDFSGGNDEGAINSAVVTRTDGTEESNPPFLEREFLRRTWDADTQTWGYADDVTEEQKAHNELAELFEAPVYDAYGSFAGDFYVEGTLTYDVTAGTVTLSGYEEVRQDEEFERSL